MGHTQQSREKLVLNKNEKQKNIQIQKIQNYKIDGSKTTKPGEN